EIQIRNSIFKVAGVLAPKGQTASGNDSDDVVLMPYTTALQTLSGRSFIPRILASTANESDIPASQEEIRTLLRESHRVEAGAEDCTVRNQSDLASAAESSTRVMTLLLAAIASISRLVGGIGIMNIMLVSVTERTREIGIRLAIGALESQVLAQFLIEAVVLSLFGGILGILMGLGIAWFTTHMLKVPFVFDSTIVLIAFGFSALVGIVFGYFPARRAARLDPIQALRHE